MEHPHDLIRTLADFIRPIFPRVSDGMAKPREAGSALKVGGRKVSAAVEGPKVRRQENAHRPAALPADDLNRGHIKLIDVRAFFAIHLDADEEAVHHFGNRIIFEAFPLHHMTPIAGAISHAEKNWNIPLSRQRKSFLAPRMPVDGVVLVLQEVGRRFPT